MSYSIFTQQAREIVFMHFISTTQQRRISASLSVSVKEKVMKPNFVQSLNGSQKIHSRRYQRCYICQAFGDMCIKCVQFDWRVTSDHFTTRSHQLQQQISVYGGTCDFREVSLVKQVNWQIYSVCLTITTWSTFKLQYVSIGIYSVCMIRLGWGEFGGQVIILSSLSHSLGHSWAVFAAAGQVVLLGVGGSAFLECLCHERVCLVYDSVWGGWCLSSGVHMNARSFPSWTLHCDEMTSVTSGFNVAADLCWTFNTGQSVCFSNTIKMKAEFKDGCGTRKSQGIGSSFKLWITLG